MSNAKELLKSIRDDVLSTLSENSLEESDLVSANTEETLLLLIASSALKRLATKEEGDSDTTAAAKAARKLVKPCLSEALASAVAGRAQASKKRHRDSDDDDSSGDEGTAPVAKAKSGTSEKSASSSLSLGQYASAGAFKNDTSKQAKFARLMGGARAGGAGTEHHRNTQAADDKTISRIQRDLENQYESAVSHKGKKGLGA